MSRWIEVDAVKEALKQNTPQYMWGEVLTTVNIQPYIDIVRCAECKYHYGEYCFRLVSKEAWIVIGSQCVITMKPDDFCSYGERSSE